MQISNIIYRLMLCMSLFVPAAMAENISVPDNNQRQGMSYEEYSNYREKMRMQMEKNKSEDMQQKQTPANSSSGQMDKPAHDSSYGKGYHSRNQPELRPDTGSSNRPDHPRGERLNRGDMGRR